MDRSTQPLVWINGWPAVGKQTVAQCLAAILGQDRAVLIDDNEFTDQLDISAEQQHIGPGETPNNNRSRENSTGTTTASSNSASSKTFTGTSKEAAKGVAFVSDAVTEEPAVDGVLDYTDRQAACFHKYLNDPATMGRIVIFTDCQPDDVEGAAGAAAYEAAARQSGRPFVPIYMECRLEENVRRTQTSERRYSLSATKIRSPMAVRTLRARTDSRLFVFPREEYPGLSVDVTEQDAHETAMQILAFLMDIEAGQGGTATP